MLQEMGFEIVSGILRGNAYVRPEKLDTTAAALAYCDIDVPTPAVSYEVATAITTQARMVVTINGEYAIERMVLADIAAKILEDMIPDVSCTTAAQPIVADEMFSLFGQNYWVRVQFVYDGEDHSNEEGPQLVSDFLKKFTTVYRKSVNTASTAQILHASAVAIIDHINPTPTPPHA